MRTIRKGLAMRLESQAQEANVQGLTKIASNLQEIIKNTPARENDQSYTYSSGSYHEDVEKLLWKAAARSMDFYDVSFDAADLDNVIKSLAANFIEEMRLLGGSEHGVGANEPTVPGEIGQKVIIEVE